MHIIYTKIRSHCLFRPQRLSDAMDGVTLVYCLDQIVKCTWVNDPENGYNDSMVWLPQQVQTCTSKHIFFIYS